jgi:mannose-6-phosphate isomerase-like protein (cupin superfamily)
MDQLRKALAGSLKGVAAREALARFRQRIRTWKLTMPPVEALVSDFGLGDFAHTGLIECWIANETRAGYCGKFLFVFDGQTCPLHRHRIKHETFFIVKGKVRMRLERRTRVMREGDVLPVPAGSYHRFTGIGPALLLEVSMPCLVADNVFRDRRIPVGRRGRCPRRTPCRLNRRTVAPETGKGGP